MITTILLLILLAICFHYYLLHFGKYGRVINLIPGPQPLPIFGDLLDFCISPSKLWEHLRKLNKQYYPIFKFWNGWEAYINIRHPDDIETVIGQPRFIQKSNAVYGLMLPWLSTGLLTSAGRKWQTRRKILTPAFHFNMLREFTDVFIQEGERLVGKLKSEGRPVVKDLKMLISEHTLNIICETAMGTSLIDKGDFQYKYRKAVHKVGITIMHRLFRPWLYIDFVFFLTPVGMLQSRLLKILHGFTKQIIKERKEYHEKTNGRYLADFDGNANEETDEMTCIRKKRLAMLDLLLSAHRHNLIDDEGIREEVDTFMFKGHDTTAASLCFTIMLLAEHPQIQGRARAEVKEIMESCNGKLGNYLVPAHTVVNVYIYDSHRNPKFWPNPDVFDPERFTPENCHGRHPYSYIPFSAGPRNCIGQKFAMLELKATMAYLLFNFIFEPVDYLKDVIFVQDLILQTEHSLRTKFVPLQVAS
ncbi:cytochrome P450 4C1-like isoform X2 [Ceratina calcarata]|uniref:Cytochrome P450 4C1-like isoform X2 n=1 Tax=Ceratina calcarata TaxID=156304 RepID=A0AAJ7W999_9HYME|nr:cytochrome P450 4C1-like isoform X2 [Ceratina calcarata]